MTNHNHCIVQLGLGKAWLWQKNKNKFKTVNITICDRTLVSAVELESVFPDLYKWDSEWYKCDILLTTGV